MKAEIHKENTRPKMFYGRSTKLVCNRLFQCIQSFFRE